MPSHRIRRRGALWAALLLAAAILPGRHPGGAAASPPAQQGFPQQAGFPRTEPVGSMGLSSPAVADLDGDGALDALAADSAGCVWAWTAAGALRPGFPLMTSGSCAQATRINAPLAVGELDGDPQLEIVAGNRGPGTAPNQRGQVFAWNHDGSLLAGWPREMAWNATFATGPAEITSVALADLTGDGRLEVLASTSNNANLGRVGYDIAQNLYAWRADGGLLPGYPTWAGTAGIYGALGAADLQCDGSADVVAGRDHAYLHAYDGGADQFAAWPARTYLDPSRDNPARDPALVFPAGAPALGDLDGRGGIEVVAAGLVRTAQAGAPAPNAGLLAFNAGGERHPGWGLAVLAGRPLTTTLLPQQAPALADLDGDGRLETVVGLADGSVRAYRENGVPLWSYDLAQGRLLFASEPAIGDVTGDGRPDILFGAYSPGGSANSAAGLYGLDAAGQPLAGFPLPLPAESGALQGVQAAPTLADLDRDGDSEILAASLAGTLYAWDLPGAYRPEAQPWPTGRHDPWRTGWTGGGPTRAVSPTATLPLRVYLPLLKRC